MKEVPVVQLKPRSSHDLPNPAYSRQQRCRAAVRPPSVAPSRKGCAVNGQMTRQETSEYLLNVLIFFCAKRRQCRNEKVPPIQNSPPQASRPCLSKLEAGQTSPQRCPSSSLGLNTMKTSVFAPTLKTRTIRPAENLTPSKTVRQKGAQRWADGLRDRGTYASRNRGVLSHTNW